jgi:hypothetical protein
MIKVLEYDYFVLYIFGVSFYFASEVRRLRVAIIDWNLKHMKAA